MLRIRPFRENDAKEIIKWTSEPEEFYKWSAGILGEFPVTEQRMLANTDKRKDSEEYFPFTAFDDDGIAGFFHIRIPGESNKYVRFGFVIVDPKKRGRGYGKEMLQLGLKYAFEIYGADTAGLGVFSNNPPAIQCYKSIGFRETGERIDEEIYGYNLTVIEMEISNG